MTADRYDPYAPPTDYGSYGDPADGGYPTGPSRNGQPYGGQAGRPSSSLPGGGRAARHSRNRHRNRQPGEDDPYLQPQSYGDTGSWNDTGGWNPNGTGGWNGAAPAPAPPQPTSEWAAGYRPEPSNAPVRWQPAPSGQWPAPAPPPGPPPPQQYFGGPPTGRSGRGMPGATGGWSRQAVAAPTAWPQVPGRAAADTGQLGGRVTPSRASRHSRQAAAQRGQAWQKRLTIAGVYLVAMVICWFYVFPWLERILPSEF